MPIIKSAKKRVKVAAKARSRNLHTKRQVRDVLKAFAAALETGKPADATKAHRDFMSAVDTAAKKNVIHVNKAARFKSRLARRLKAAGIKPTKVTDSMPVVKKPAAKQKTPAKNS